MTGHVVIIGGPCDGQTIPVEGFTAGRIVLIIPKDIDDYVYLDQLDDIDPATMLECVEVTMPVVHTPLGLRCYWPKDADR